MGLYLHVRSALVLTAVVLLFCATAAASESEERRYIEALGDRQLFQLAERYCRDRLNDSSRDESSRAFYAKELSRILVRHALVTPWSESAPLWSEAFAVLEPFFAADSIGVALLARTQASLVTLSQGEALALQPVLSDEDRNHALSLLRDASRRFGDIAQDAQKQSRLAQQSSQLRVDELRSLANQVICRQAQAYRLAASLHAPNTPDRADALNRAIALLEPLVDLPADQPLAWESRLNLIAAHRLARDHAAATKSIAAIQQPGAPVDAQQRARAEAILLALDRNELSTALKLARQVRPSEEHAVPELDDARLQAVLANWRSADQARDDARRDEFEREAQVLALAIRDHYGGIWTARAQRHVASIVGNVSHVSDLSVLQQAAEAHLQAGQVDQAIAGYDRAAAAAKALNDLDNAFRFGFLSATLEHQRRRYDQASHRYRQLARTWPDSPRATEAHLLAAHDAWMQLRSTGETDLGPYVALLREHLRLWPGFESAHEARWRLGRVAEQQRELPAAIDAYRGVSPAHARGADSLASLLRCYEQLLADSPSADAPPPIVTEGARYFESLSSGDALRDSPELRHQAAISAARLWQGMPTIGADAARRTLQAYLASSDLTVDQRDEAQNEILLLDLENADAASAESQLAQFDHLSADQVYRSLQRLARGAGSSAEKSRRMAELSVRLATRNEAQIAQLADTAQRDCRLWHAQAHLQLDQTAAALALYEQLHTQWPNDLAVTQGLARALSREQASAQRERALQLWRKVEQAEPRGGDAWLESRLEIARLHHALGNAEQARRIVRTTRLLYPATTNSALQSQLAALEDELAR